MLFRLLIIGLALTVTGTGQGGLSEARTATGLAKE
jgi:hypothetical protein